MSKLIIFLLFYLYEPNVKILEQGEVFVPISDMDGYVYSLPPEKRAGFISDKYQIEKNLITMLNINIVNDYIVNNKLTNHKVFNNVDEGVNEFINDLDEEFYLQLGLKKEDAYQSVHNFIIKKERFIRMSDLIKSQFDEGALDTYLKEYFYINKADFFKPEKRDISLIKLNSDVYQVSKIKSILKDLLKNDEFSYFGEIALKNSSDESVVLNQGHLKEFNKGSFSYPFAESVFAPSITGVIPKIFKHDEHYYIVRVNGITPQVEPKFEDYKQILTDRLLPDLVQERLQRIIDSKAKYKVEVNHEVAAHLFERYKVLIED